MTLHNDHAQCSRPKCNNRAVAVLIQNYQERKAILDKLDAEIAGDAFYLCGKHANRASVPSTWELVRKVKQFNEDADVSDISKSITIAKATPEKAASIVENAPVGTFVGPEPDDDLTVIMRQVNRNTAINTVRGQIPQEHRGAERGNLVAIRTGNTETNPTVENSPENAE